jgi:hypothetical protein
MTIRPSARDFEAAQWVEFANGQRIPLKDPSGEAGRAFLADMAQLGFHFGRIGDAIRLIETDRIPPMPKLRRRSAEGLRR